MSIPTVQLPSGKTAYNILGNKDASNWVLVFGGYHFPRNCDNFFKSLSEALGDDFALLLYDYYGRGESDAPDGRYDAPMYMQQVEQLIEKLGLQDKKFQVIGYSFGGATSTHFCRKHPEKAKSLILSGAWHTWEPFPAATTIMTKMGLSGMLYKAYWNAMPGALKKGFNQPDQAIIDNMLKVEKEIMGRTDGNLKIAVLRTFKNFSRKTKDTVKAIANHPRPVLLAWGDNDQIAPFKFAKAMHAIMPNSTLKGLDGNHNDLWLQEEKASKLRAAMVEFLNANKN